MRRMSFGGRPVFPAVCLLACWLSASVGCGPPEPFTHVKITGLVTYEDGTPIPAHRLEVWFEPQTPPKDERTHPRPGAVDAFDETGAFQTVTTHKYADGVVVGKHKIRVLAFDENDRQSRAVPREYGDVNTTPLEFDTADYSPKNPLHIKVRKP